MRVQMMTSTREPAPVAGRPAVEIEHLRKTYGPVVAVDDLGEPRRPVRVRRLHPDPHRVRDRHHRVYLPARPAGLLPAWRSSRLAKGSGTGAGGAPSRIVTSPSAWRASSRGRRRRRG